MRQSFHRSIILLATYVAVTVIPLLGNAYLFDWDEVNFAECAREMIVTGDYYHPQIDFEPFWEKPPLFSGYRLPQCRYLASTSLLHAS